MRIGIVTQSYYPIHGGVAEHVHAEAVELERRGHAVTIITAYFNRGDEQFASPHVERIGMDLTIPIAGAFVNVTIGRHLGDDLRRIVRDRRLDVLHIHQPLDPVLPLVATRAVDLPMVGTFHTYQRRSIYYDIFRWYLGSSIRRLAERIYVSEASRSYIEHYFPGPYTLIPNGVSLDRFHPGVPTVERFDDDVFTILFVGRMDPRKGIRHLLHAYRIVKRSLPKSRLVIVGGGILQAYYQRMADRLGTPDVFFEGYVTAEQLPRYYASADVFCSPVTGNESFGIVLIEAMASGNAIVGSDIGGYRYVIQHESNGLLVPPANPARLAAALVRVAQE
ncbi:MAG: glycosyltransferase family 4 protein, partial [Candidatus Kerfeldbacteria bacterium]|nr:glycosyltransferase family 4 protein [Candidatus Kerfeldbacteria bacterium]